MALCETQANAGACGLLLLGNQRRSSYQIIFCIFVKQRGQLKEFSLSL